MGLGVHRPVKEAFALTATSITSAASSPLVVTTVAAATGTEGIGCEWYCEPVDVTVCIVCYSNGEGEFLWVSAVSPDETDEASAFDAKDSLVKTWLSCLVCLVMLVELVN